MKLVNKQHTPVSAREPVMTSRSDELELEA